MDEKNLRRAIGIARNSRERGDHPFGALLADPAGVVLLEAENTVVTERDATGHAETNLVRLATRAFDQDYLTACTLYTSTEPCAMCTGAIYWSGIGTIVYGLAETALKAIVGADPANPTLDLPCREVLARGPRPVAVRGPALTELASAVHQGFWN